VNTKKIIIIGGAGLAIAAVLVSLFKSDTTRYNASSSEIPQNEALDVTIDFYNAWLQDSLSTTTDPFESGLINSAVLSDEVRAQIRDKQQNKAEGDLDAVFCQSELPGRVGGKEILSLEKEAQIMVLARGLEERSPYQAVVTLTAVNGNWQISKIECLQGEVPPEREYDFERNGFLLKSVPAPYATGEWHLIYEENGTPGHVLPLFFGAGSVCVAADSTEAVCDPSKFVEPAKVLLQAGMLDTGADVRRVTFE
jgi:hypothetical protein